MALALRWTIWIILFLVTLSFFYGTARSVFVKKSFSYAIVIQTILLIAILGVFFLKGGLGELLILSVSSLILFGISYLTDNSFADKNKSSNISSKPDKEQ